MLLYITVLVVAFSPYQQQDYSAAIAELDAVSRIDLKKFIKDSSANLNALSRDSKENRDFVEACHFSIRYELNKIGQDVLELESSRFKHHCCIAAFDVEQIERLQSSRIIGDYRRLIVDDLGVDWIWFNPSFLAEAFLREFRIPNKIPNEFRGYPAEASLFMNCPEYCPSGTKNFCGDVTLELIFTKPKLGTFRAEVTNPPIWKVGKFEETGFQKWLIREGILKSLVEPSVALDQPCRTESLFPNLQPWWKLVEDKTPEEAKRILMEKVAEPQNKISFSGVEVDAWMIVVVGPIAASTLLLFFISYVRNLKRISNNDSKLLSTFPWLILFPGYVYRCAVVFLAFLLPLVSFTSLLWQFRDSGAFNIILGLVFTVITILLAYWSLKEILDIRSKVCS